MDLELNDAAADVANGERSIDELYSLIGVEPTRLNVIDAVPNVQTPLHVAASNGNIPFAIELVRLKPSFLWKLNGEGYAPIHLASQNGQIDLAVRLAKVDKKVIRIPGREGYTPLHFAAQTGNQDLLSKILEIYPESILDVTSKNETVLHIALKHGKRGIFRRLKEWLMRSSTTDDRCFWRSKLFHWKDDGGNTVSKLAIENDLVDGIIVKFRQAFYQPWDESNRETAQVTGETRNAMLVVLALLGTITFQIILTPPGGTWQEDTPTHRAGTAIIGRGPFLTLVAFNAISFIYTFSAAVSVLPNTAFSACVTPLSSLTVCFVISIFVTYPSSKGLSWKTLFPVSAVPFLFVWVCALVAMYVRKKTLTSPMKTKDSAPFTTTLTVLD